MSRRVRPVSHEDRLSLVEHLDELRSRLIVSAAAFGVALALCFWQNHLLLEIASGPLPSDHKQLITFGVTEPFTTTLTVAAYGAIILSLPVLLYQAYAYVLPAFSDAERRVALPIMLMAPVLFLAGVAFAYFVVMPAAVKFLLNFNDSQFNVQVRARDYYSFFSMTMLAGGIVFQLPLAILAVTRLGIVSVAQLSSNRRYAYLVDRPRRRGAAGRRPGLDADRDGSPACFVRVEYLACTRLRQAEGGGRHGQTLYAGEIGTAMASSGERRLVFDTRGKRKHVVRVVYAILALLMGGSLFLVVGAGQHRLAARQLEQLQQRQPRCFDEQAERIERRLAKRPRRRTAAAGADASPHQRRQRADRTPPRKPKPPPSPPKPAKTSKPAPKPGTAT